MMCLLTAGSYCRAQAPAPPDSQNINNKDIPLQVINNRSEPPSMQIAEEIAGLTRYGFANLFTKYSYNPEMPYSVQVNPKSEKFMGNYMKRHESYFINMKKWGRPYFNLIDDIMPQYGLPRELKYLAVIESNLSVASTSWVGAAGPWQFMPQTGRDYGLTVSRSIDERRDYRKSTHAAARFLLRLFNEFHDWLLVIAAYNCGPGRVNYAIRKSGSRDFWILQAYLPEESRNHVKKFIATHCIMEGQKDDQSGLLASGAGSDLLKRNISAAAFAETDTQMISGKYIAAILAAKLEMEVKEFTRYNPNMDDFLSKTGSYMMILPTNKMELFEQKKYEILNACINQIMNGNEVPPPKTIKEPQKRKG